MTLILVPSVLDLSNILVIFFIKYVRLQFELFDDVETHTLEITFFNIMEKSKSELVAHLLVDHCQNKLTALR